MHKDQVNKILNTLLLIYFEGVPCGWTASHKAAMFLVQAQPETFVALCIIAYVTYNGEASSSK